MFTRENIFSLLHTFIATFVVSFAGAIAMIPADTFFSASTWSTTALIALVMTAARAGVKALSGQVFRI